MERLLHKHHDDSLGDVVIPKEVLNQILDAFEKMEAAMSTLEILADEDTMKSIENSRKDIKHGHFVDGSVHDLEKVLAE